MKRKNKERLKERAGNKGGRKRKEEKEAVKQNLGGENEERRGRKTFTVIIEHREIRTASLYM